MKVSQIVDQHNFKNVLTSRFREELRTMPIMGIKTVMELVAGQSLTRLLFDAAIFKSNTLMVQKENEIRSQGTLSSFILMTAAPQMTLDELRIVI